MARKDRTGNCTKRDKRKVRRIPEMGYYLVVTDTEATERCFFNGLYNSLPAKLQQKLVIKVVETKTQNLIQKCLELTAYEAQYRIPWIVFDRDQVVNFDNIIQEAEKNGFRVGWSNPCFEIWMHAYFGNMPNIQESWTCCDRFGTLYKRKTGQQYSKADEDLYKRLVIYGDEEKAITIAQRKLTQWLKDGCVKPSEMCPCTTVHELIGEIKSKAGSQMVDGEL